MRTAIEFLRRAGWAEAVSFIVLLGVAMPLKYIWHMPEAVRIVGSIHGGLFLIFCAALVRAMRKAEWPLTRAALVFAMAFLPFGPFLIDGKLRRYEEECTE